ncbi:hypothetical protein R3P38DRAFT_3193729 [Favolaschia claudopus]|uniref:Uncharacterized protein n=1 Tax=Favolaschia claudopus TaxID=2862362 RepID=A0AAW0BEP2_9AGAR
MGARNKELQACNEARQSRPRRSGVCMAAEGDPWRERRDRVEIAQSAFRRIHMYPGRALPSPLHKHADARVVAAGEDRTSTGGREAMPFTTSLRYSSSIPRVSFPSRRPYPPHPFTTVAFTRGAQGRQRSSAAHTWAQDLFAPSSPSSQEVAAATERKNLDRTTPVYDVRERFQNARRVLPFLLHDQALNPKQADTTISLPRSHTIAPAQCIARKRNAYAHI